MKKSLLKKIAITTSILSTTAFATSVSAETINVQSGDTIWKLAQEHNVAMQDIIETNDLSSTSLYVGQPLTIPEDQYTVQSGDTLWIISQKFNTSVTAIKRENRLSSNMLYVGQTLSIPESSSRPSSYQVQHGDTLWIISQKFDVSIQEIMDWNNLSSTYLYQGQTLHLEEQETSLSNEIIQTAEENTGIHYSWGGSHPSEGFDCSGFLNYVFEQNGVDLPRTVSTIYQAGTHVSQPEVGDLVFFETYKEGASHAGIYIGDGEFIHASSSRGITVSSMDNVYWEPRYLGAKSYY